MQHPGFTLFDSPIGRCGLAWGPTGLLAVQLPERRDALTRARLAHRAPGAIEGRPPLDAQRAIDGILSLLDGRSTDLSSIELDMAPVPRFHRRVYDATRGVAAGSTSTYGEIAALAGSPGGARAVGQALGANPFAIVVPCHRVLSAGGRIGGFSANGGTTTKLRLLAIERARVNGASATAGNDGTLGYDWTAAVEHLCARDPELAAVIERVGPARLELKTTPSIFGALAEAIVHQQLTGRAAAAIYARLCACFPRPLDGPSPELLLRCSDDQLRAAGLSRSKSLALRDLAERAARGAIPTLDEARALDDADLIERLTAVRGVGRWTVEMLLIFRLGRPDVLPLDDYGVRKGFAAAFGRADLPTRTELEERGARWRPFRSAASWYLWRAAEAFPIR